MQCRSSPCKWVYDFVCLGAGLTQHFYKLGDYTWESETPRVVLDATLGLSESQTKKSQERFGRSSFLCLTLTLCFCAEENTVRIRESRSTTISSPPKDAKRRLFLCLNPAQTNTTVDSPTWGQPAPKKRYFPKWTLSSPPHLRPASSASPFPPSSPMSTAAKSRRRSLLKSSDSRAKT